MTHLLRLARELYPTKILIAVFLIPVAILIADLALAQGLVTGSTLAPTLPVDPNSMNPDELSVAIGIMRKAYVSRDWRLLASMLLTTSILAFKMLGLNKLIPKKHNKWVAGGLAMATSVSIGLMTGISWWSIVMTGLSVFLSAVGGWEVVVEPIIKKLGWADAEPVRERTS